MTELVRVQVLLDGLVAAYDGGFLVSILVFRLGVAVVLLLKTGYFI